jgi:transposase-like protein
MAFAPPYCPNPACPSHAEGARAMRPRSSFRRKCDGRTVSRFACDRCKKILLDADLPTRLSLAAHGPVDGVFMSLCSKVTLRQSARYHRCDRKTIAARLKLFGEHCKKLHLGVLEHVRSRGGIQGSFQLDELETYETDRRLFP